MKILGFLPSKVLRSVSAPLHINTGLPEFPLRMGTHSSWKSLWNEAHKISHNLDWFTSEEGVNFWLIFSFLLRKKIHALEEILQWKPIFKSLVCFWSSERGGGEFVCYKVMACPLKYYKQFSYRRNRTFL